MNRQLRRCATTFGLSLGLFATGCTITDPAAGPQPTKPAPCSYASALPVEKAFQDQPGMVYAIKGTPYYVIKTDYYVDMLPCNLPQAYRQDRLRVRFSGTAYQLNVPYLDVVGRPLELTHLRVAQ